MNTQLLLSDPSYTITPPNLKRRKATAVAELPEELVCQEILPWLPIESAVRFKCVCKSWLSLFSTPEFVEQHLARNTSSDPTAYDCLVTKKYDSIVMLSRYKETFALAAEGIRLVGCVRGLVCLHQAGKFNLSLWNPAIHQYKKFTLPRSRRRGGDHIKDMGLGFDPVSGNYKVAVLSADLRRASVYYSSSDSWINVSVPDDVHLLRKRGGTLLDSSIIIVKDCPYWTFTTYAGDPNVAIMLDRAAASLTPMKFDVGSDKFKLLPEFQFDTRVHGDSYESIFLDMNDSLKLIVYDRNSSNYMLHVYSLDGEGECCGWSKTYTVGPVDICRRRLLVSHQFYNGEIVFQDDAKKFSCYDQKTGEKTKQIGTIFKSIGHPTNYVISCFRYTPSLVFVQGMKSVYIATKTGCTTGLGFRVPRKLITTRNHSTTVRDPQRLIDSLKN